MNLRSIGFFFFMVTLLWPTAWAGAVAYTYDSLNRLIKAEYESGVQVTHTYDEVGNLTSIAQIQVYPPSAPTLNSITVGPGSATLVFSAPVYNGGLPISIYTATCSATGQATRTATGYDSPLTVLNLVGGVTYQCSLSATNSGGFISVASALMSVIPTSKFPWAMFLPAITHKVQ
jgi:YD repeat-containing protein